MYDPFITKDLVENQYHDLHSFLRDTELVVVLVGHDEIKQNKALLKDKIVFDTRNVVDLPGVYHL